MSADASGPISTGQRITSLDTIRGIAMLAILPMNALSFGLEGAGYSNVSADGIRQPFDWVVGIATMLFVDQKAMALFSLLFGVGVVVFAERARAKGRRVVWLSLWRFVLLGIVGVVHTMVWEGDILLLYALCAPFVLLLKGLPARGLLTFGVGLSLIGPVTAPFVQGAVNDGDYALGDFWFVGEGPMADEVFLWFAGNGFGRALGLMLIGVALFRMGIVQGDRSPDFYRAMVRWGLGAGTAVTAAGLVFRVVDDWSPDAAITGNIPTGLGTIPMALGYMAAFILLDRRGGEWVERLRNVGRMALTNYLTQTALGLVTLTWLLGDVDLGRTVIAVWVLGVWALQYAWSTWWLERFRFGGFEWAWRCATYRTWQPLRR